MEIAIATTSGSAETLTPGTTSDALNQLSVEFDHGPGSNNGATGILLTAGFCPDGDELLDLSNTDGLTDTTTTVSCTGTGPTAGPTACESTYEIGFDLTTTTLDLDEDGKLYFCVTHFFEHETGAVLDASGDEVTAATDVVLNFQQTDVTVTFDLVTESIIGFIFQTAKSSPDLEGITLDEILAEAIEISEPSTPVDPNDSNSPKYYVQGQLMSWDICPIDPSEMFRTAALVSLKAEGTRDGNDPQFQQYLTTASGATQDAIFAQIFQSTVNPDCLNIQFILQSDFFAIFETVGDNAVGPLPVQVSGTVRFTEKTERRTLRAENESRQLQTRVTESDVEMNMVLGVTADANSGSYLVSVSSFTLLGAAGAALLI